MKLTTTKIACILLVFAMLSIYLNYFSTLVMPWQKEEVIKTTLLWGGLDKLPKNAEFTNMEKRGSMFTRQFIIEFTSKREDIEKWKSLSKRLKNKIPKIKANTEIFEIYPGEDGAMGGKVEITGNNVKINISWS
ncbi:hypothetical protein ACFSJW_00580 [Flavobacterium artemisiae]|uniref:Uncharacterized protein n=1 Tax=Flavobacterium artemisiae TaxID=2126556 RepID=A0ABW4HHM2_9FLAO